MGHLRKPLALADWKMAMTITESRGFAEAFCPAVDGLGAGRKGRDPVAFAQIVQWSARVKGKVP